MARNLSQCICTFQLGVYSYFLLHFPFKVMSWNVIDASEDLD